MQSKTILAVERALIILNFLSESGEGFGVRDLGRELGYSPAVTQKILSTLKVHGYVQQDEDTERYRLGVSALHLGLSMLSRLDVLNVAHPFMESLTHRTGETTFLAIRDDVAAVYIDKVTSPHDIRMDAKVGARRPLNCTAVGKVLLAWGAAGLVSQLVEHGAIKQQTENSITDPQELEEELARVRERGYALDCREYLVDAMCAAAPIFGQDGQVVASVTASCPAFRVEDRIEEIAKSVVSSAAKISAQLGYRKT